MMYLAVLCVTDAINAVADGIYRPKYTVKELPSYLVKERHSLTLVQTAQDDKRSHGDTHASFTVFQQCCLVLELVQLYVQ
eukprot:2550-Heterococcus_DN1.PRE.2